MTVIGRCVCSVCKVAARLEQRGNKRVWVHNAYVGNAHKVVPEVPAKEGK